MKSSLWIGLAVAIILGLLWQFYPLQDSSERLDAIPLIGLGYTGKKVPLNEFEKDFFKKVKVFKRIYTVSDRNYFVTVIDGTNNRHVVHDPYYCFRGGGWTVVEENPYPLEKGNAGQLKISKQGQTRDALYWFTDGNKQFTSPMQYWFQATLRRLTLGNSGPEPLLIVVQPLDNEPTDWDHFSRNFYPLFKL